MSTLEISIISTLASFSFLKTFYSVPVTAIHFVYSLLYCTIRSRIYSSVFLFQFCLILNGVGAVQYERISNPDRIVHFNKRIKKENGLLSCITFF